MSVFDELIYIGSVNYKALLDFVREHTDANTLSMEKGSVPYSQFVDWFNKNSEWTHRDKDLPDGNVPFKVTASVANFDTSVYNPTVVSNIHGFNGRGVLTDHVINRPLVHCKESFESHYKDICFGDENTFIEFTTDGTVEGTSVYSIVLVDVNEATRIKN